MEENLNNNLEKKNKIKLIIITIVTISVFFIAILLLKTFETNKSAEETTTTTTTTSSTSENSSRRHEEFEHRTTAYDDEFTTVYPENMREKDKEETYKFKINGKDKTIKFTYYFVRIEEEFKNDRFEGTKRVVGYNYYLEVSSGKTSYGTYLIGSEIIKSKASTVTDENGKRPTYNIDMVQVFKDSTWNTEYLLLLIPEYYGNEEGVLKFEVKPTVFSEDGNLLRRIDTTFYTNGVTYPKDEKYGFTKELIENNYGVYKIDINKTIIFFDKDACNQEKATLKQFNMFYGKPLTSEYATNVEVTGVGETCNN